MEIINEQENKMKDKMDNEALNKLSNIILKELYKYRVKNQITFHIDRVPEILLNIIQKIKGLS